MSEFLPALHRAATFHPQHCEPPVDELERVPQPLDPAPYSRVGRVRLSSSIPGWPARLAVDAPRSLHVAARRVRLQHRSHRQGDGVPDDLHAVPAGRPPRNLLGTPGRLRVLYSGVRQHRRVLLRHIFVL